MDRETVIVLVTITWVVLGLLGHELWRINETLKRIADILREMSEDREEKGK